MPENESEEFFRTFTESVDVAIFLYQDYKLIYANPTAEKLTEYNLNELRSMNLMDLIHPDYKNLIMELGSVIERNEMVETKHILKIITKRGSEKWINGNFVLIEYGGERAALISAIDITDQKIAEQMLKKSEEKYRNLSQELEKKVIERTKELKESEVKFRDLFNFMSSGVAVYDAINDGKDFIFKDFNMAGEKIDGIKKEDLIGKSVSDLFPGVKEFGLFDVFQRVWETGNPERHPITQYKDNRITGWRDNYVYKLPSGEVIAVYDDITEKKIIEQKLKESEERFKTIFMDSPIGIELYDSKGKLLELNKACLDMFGVSNINSVRDFDLFQDPNISDEVKKKLYNGEFIKYESTFDFEKVKELNLYETTKSGIIFVDVEITPLYLDGTEEISNFLVQVQDITEKKQAEERLQQLNKELEYRVEERTKDLKESEEKYRSLFSNTIEGIAVHSIIYDSNNKPINYIITDINPKFEDILSIKKEDVLNKKATDAYGVENAPYLDIYAKVAETMEPTVFETYYPPMDKFFKISVFSPEKGIFVTVFEDISERKKAEQKLKEERLKAQNYLDIAGVIMLVINSNQIIELINKKGCEILGYNEEDILGKNWFDNFIPEYLREDVKLVFDKLMKGEIESVEYYENPLINSNGEEKIIAWHNTLLRNKNGKIIGTLSSGEDITIRKESEKNLKLNQFAIDHTLIEVFWINSDGKFLYVNKAACNNLGYSYEELLTKSVPDVDPLHDINIYKQVWEELKEKGFLTFETLHQRKDGATYPVQVTTNYLEFEGDEYNFAFAVDTTKIKEAERLVLEEVKKLRELDEIRDDIVTRVSHELKTPLTSTYMASEIILDQYKEKLNGNLSALIQTIHKGCFRLKSLIDNLLDVSKISVQKLEINANKENLVELINECVNEMIYLISSRQLTLKLNMPDTIYHEVDKLRIGQVITNIVSNAIKNTPTGGAIYISVNENPEYLDIQIRDTGVGLTDKEKERLFEKFGKIERYGKGLDVDIEGSGLGLFISKHIVNLHNGEILVESEGRNKGATFTIRLYKK